MITTPFDPPQLSRVLVTKLRHHGDVLLASPVLSMLKRIAPQAEIDGLVYADTAPMLAGHPALSQLHLIDRNWKQQGVVSQAAAEWGLIRDLRARHYDLVVHLSVHTRGSWLVRLLRPRWSVAPNIPDKPGVAFWRSSFTHLYPSQSDPERHTVDTNLDSLRALGLTPLEEDKRVTLVAGAAADAKIAALLAQYGLTAGGFIHIHPASRWQFKCWPAERMAALCDLLVAKAWPIVLTSAPDANEKALVAAILAARKASESTAIDFAGQLSLKELAALSAQARLFVGVDSAPMHIAAAMGTPTVGIFGPSGDLEWGPWGQPMTLHRAVASITHPCRPCGMAGCNDSKISACLVNLPVAQVMQACEELLA